MSAASATLARRGSAKASSPLPSAPSGGDNICAMGKCVTGERGPMLRESTEVRDPSAAVSMFARQPLSQWGVTHRVSPKFHALILSRDRNDPARRCAVGALNCAIGTADRQEWPIVTRQCGKSPPFARPELETENREQIAQEQPWPQTWRQFLCLDKERTPLRCVRNFRGNAASFGWRAAAQYQRAIRFRLECFGLALRFDADRFRQRHGPGAVQSNKSLWPLAIMPVEGETDRRRNHDRTFRKRRGFV